ncbi:MAG: hypothetical protein MI673_10675, partial [Thiotrichales bacterium]|nr:hypothetical protein [Thiotrichales bacterium]
MNREIMELLGAGVTMVTPARHLARALINRHSRFHLEQGHNSWESADVLDWNTWCRRCWDALQVNSQQQLVLLNSHQEQVL